MFLYSITQVENEDAQVDVHLSSLGLENSKKQEQIHIRCLLVQGVTAAGCGTVWGSRNSSSAAMSMHQLEVISKTPCNIDQVALLIGLLIGLILVIAKVAS